ncbi:glycosyltransferase family 2 protein [Lacisediminihabitans changchengi]|uniref:Glycosyltransferase family 2 protein n=1 Tax=Lacisediminihabitans changchengi TaxID=2787634 RepID=A0A934W138_9MICO|nr:glycosyltransferase family 2 protein [Lacisediminihabitans changchengi]MBK4346473.1 glycosyltransferase family 2 protein [Lacisediminihabitans changchengi]MBK4348899.1 glycosyltransferase family 2 protein [Lacisediminihabitans changchengi]
MTPSAHQPSPPVVGVVTVSFGSADVLGGFLDSVPAASALPLAVVVADNRANDSEAERLARAAAASYLPLDHNYGYGGAMNLAVRTLPNSIEWVLISNPDVVLQPGSIDTLLAVGSTDPMIGAVGPSIMTDGAVYPSARAVPSLRTGIGHALFANIWIGNPWTRAYRRDTSTTEERRDAGWLSGACLLVRRSAFDSLGGFDDGYFMYFEDVDLGYRLGKAGFRNVYEPDAVVTHSGAHSTSDNSGLMIRAHHTSARRFLSRKYSGWVLWPVRVTLSIGLAVRSALLARRSRRP